MLQQLESNDTYGVQEIGSFDIAWSTVGRACIENCRKHFGHMRLDGEPTYNLVAVLWLERRSDPSGLGLGLDFQKRNINGESSSSLITRTSDDLSSFTAARPDRLLWLNLIWKCEVTPTPRATRDGSTLMEAPGECRPRALRNYSNGHPLCKSWRLILDHM